MKKLFPHSKTIRDDKLKFIVWILTSVVLSLGIVWIPTLFGLIIHKNLFLKQTQNNPIILFSIALLGNVISAAINQPGAGSNRFAAGLRSVTIIVVFLYLIFLAALVPLKPAYDISISISTQFILLVITLTLAIYTYGFREVGWEKTVDDVRNEEEQQIANMRDKANTITQEGGIKL